MLSILIFLCSLLGLPWFVAATVQAISHVRSLVRESDVKIPGEKPQIIGIRSAVNQSINQGFFYNGLSNLNHCEVH